MPVRKQKRQQSVRVRLMVCVLVLWWVVLAGCILIYGNSGDVDVQTQKTVTVDNTMDAGIPDK
jgi:formate hydrogenlyase subunit 3/multisubunit Na+/H+ antiporter MnhD subunit